MAFRLARLGVLAVFAISLALPAAASATSGGASAPPETGAGYNPGAPSGGAAAGAVEPPARPPKPSKHSSGGDHKGTHRKKHSTKSRPRFPIAGPHNYGGPAARFGAPRGNHTHQGQDVLAAEGTPLVAPLRGYVKYVSDQPCCAGIYIVMHASGTPYDFVFMHLQPGSVRVGQGQSVQPGTRIGSVGHTGDATGPHLHFEVWDGAWQAGGHPIDPLPLLLSWDH
ncbi:MAG: M23 family metallopeptidase [Actinobacteria bacterium]|nr:M23 family metallopeptidase [Actinomycetota bacterium]